MPTSLSTGISPTVTATYGPPITHCSSRELDGQIIEARKIRDCFDIFFAQYVHFLPLLDPHLTPDAYYQLCPFLFWTIVYIGSRRYSPDPTLIHRLSSCINTKALLALSSRAASIQTIEGLLLLCLWPVPINTAQKDISHVLSGAAITLATQIGLHVTGVGQEFARAKLVGTQSLKLFRAQLWMHCIIICNSVSIRDGLPPLTLANSAMYISDSEGLIDELPRDLINSWEMHKVLISATAAISKQAHPTACTSTAQPSALSPFINLFDTQLTDMISPHMTTLNHLHLHCCRLHILAYHFLEPAAAAAPLPNKEGLLRLYTVACGFVSEVEAAYQPPAAELLTTFLERTLTLAAICILKIRRSPLAPLVDLAAGEKTYFSAIRLVRRASVDNGDLGARCASILGQLWTSRKVFRCRRRRRRRRRRRSDGVRGATATTTTTATTRRAEEEDGGLETKMRSRLSLSVVFDAFWWWREEFDGRPNPYKDEDDEDDDGDEDDEDDGGGSEQTTTTTSQEAASPGPLLQQQQQGQDTINTAQMASGIPVANTSDMTDPFALFSNDPFPDYDWAANVDFSNFDLAILDQLGGRST